GFNTNIAKLARDKARSLIAEGKTVKILCVGKKGFDAIKRELGQYVIKTIELRGVKNVAFSNADEIGAELLSMYADGEFDICTLFYSKFESVIAQVPTAQQLIPADLPTEAAGDDDGAAAVYEYEPDEAEILEDLLPRNISVQVFRALLENAASEQGARMSAMDNATRNAGDMIDKLTISYNRQRQAQITTELIEIISGAEAL
ncbi:ATP synthase F1 subunit gamma, partial [Roseibium sp.]